LSDRVTEGGGQWRWPDAAPQAADGHETRPYETLAAHHTQAGLRV